MPRKKKMTKDEVAENLKQLNIDYSKGIDYYKGLVEQRRKNRKVGQEQAFQIYNKVKSYIAENNGPITISGMILASDLTKSQWTELKEGAADYDLFAFADAKGIDINSCDTYDGMPYTKYKGEDILLLPFSELIEKFYLMHEDELEKRLYEKGRSGDIFALKAKHKWIEEEKAPQTVNQTLVIASPDEAKKALELLK